MFIEQLSNKKERETQRLYQAYLPAALMAVSEVGVSSPDVLQWATNAVCISDTSVSRAANAVLRHQLYLYTRRCLRKAHWVTEGGDARAQSSAELGRLINSVSVLLSFNTTLPGTAAKDSSSSAAQGMTSRLWTCDGKACSQILEPLVLLTGTSSPAWLEFVLGQYKGKTVDTPDSWPQVGKVSRNDAVSVLQSVAFDAQDAGWLSGLRFGDALRIHAKAPRPHWRGLQTFDGWRLGLGEEQWREFLALSREWAVVSARLPPHKTAHVSSWVARFVLCEDLPTALKAAEVQVMQGWHALCAISVLPNNSIFPPTAEELEGSSGALEGVGNAAQHTPLASALAQKLFSIWQNVSRNLGGQSLQHLESIVIPLAHITTVFGKQRQRAVV